jgi:hypothetical protein
VQAAACLLKGYVAEYPLLPAERPHLLTLACARLATSVTLGAYSYAQDPSNKYLLIHAEPAWAALHTLWYRCVGGWVMWPSVGGKDLVWWGMVIHALVFDWNVTPSGHYTYRHVKSQ